MLRQRHRENQLLFLGSDLLSTGLAFAAAWILRFEFAVVPLTKSVPEWGRYLQLVPFILILWPIVFYFHGLYQLQRGHSRVEELFSIIMAEGLATLLLAGLTTFYRPAREAGSLEYFTYSRWFLALFLISGTTFTAGARFSLRAVLRARRLRGHSVRRILVVGASDPGMEIAEKIRAHRELGFEVVGFADDDPHAAQRLANQWPVLGRLTDIREIVGRHSVDQLMIALPLEAHRKITRVLEQVENECVEVRLVPNLLQYASFRAGLEDVDGTPVINLSYVPLEGWRSLAKRAMDVAISLTSLTILLPLVPFIAALIWLEDRGPLFYRQERMGLDGRPFDMLKFRSMRVNAESSTGPIWAVENDPRRTRVGSFLRRTSLDELPQLWNVVRGDMSLVGPRPERPTFVDEFKHKMPSYMLRHRVKAGMTGWAQVHGWRGNTSIRKRLQYDLYYVENWSLGLDLRILWMTLRMGWLHNAY